MKPVLVVVAVGTAAGLAVADSYLDVTIAFTASSTTVSPGETVLWTMTVSWTGGSGLGEYFGSINAHLTGLGTAGGTASPMTGFDWANPALGVPLAGTPQGTSLLDVYGAQHPLFGPVPFINPFAIGQFEVIYHTEGDASYTVADRNQNWAFFIGYPVSDFEPALNGDRADEVTVVTDIVRVIPAPSVLAVLGFGGLIMGRRRRDAGFESGAVR